MIDLHDNERVVIIARRHWFVFVSEVITMVFGIVPILLVLLFSEEIYSYGERYLSYGEISNILVFLGAAWLLVLWMKFFMAFTNYYLDVLVVTNQRVIDIDQIGLFARDIATAPLENVQDIKIETIGMIPTMLRFGNLYFQTAAADKEIMVKGIKNPEEVKKRIMTTFHAPQNQAWEKLEPPAQGKEPGSPPGA
ncbi:MAG TPA: PH domain-containing protein [Candidatus Paceibacterota bacterium]